MQTFSIFTHSIRYNSVTFRIISVDYVNGLVQISHDDEVKYIYLSPIIRAEIIKRNLEVEGSIVTIKHQGNKAKPFEITFHKPSKEKHMSKHKKQPKNYVVRGFNTGDTTFNTLGRIDASPTFTEVVGMNQAEAIILMLTNANIKTMMPTNLRDHADFQGGGTSILNELVDNNGENAEMLILDLTIRTGADSVRDLRAAKTELREVLKLWAEKCRVRGIRGWRASAIKEPTFERSHDGDIVQIRTQIILSTAVFYNQRAVTTGFPETPANLEIDLNNLVWHLNRIPELEFTELLFKAGTLSGSLN